MRNLNWKNRKAQSAVQAARDASSELLKARGTIAQLLAVYWEEGDGAYPPNFIVTATGQADFLTDKDLKAFHTTRVKGKFGNAYKWKRVA